MTRYYHIFILLAFSFLFICQKAASVEENGLLFRSHEVRPDKRTSLCLPADPSKGVEFSGSFSISFDVRIDNDKEKFGYICRVVLDRKESIDILLSTPYSGIPFIGVTSGQKDFTPVRFDDEDGLDLWHCIKIDLRDAGSELEVSVNGNVIRKFETDCRNHSVFAFFGAASGELFSSSDAAPMSIRNLSVQIDGRRNSFWTLSSVDDLTSDRNISLSSKNPVWIKDFCRKWQLVRSFSENSRTFAAVDGQNELLYLISAEHVIEYDLSSDKFVKWDTPNDDLSIGFCTNDFYVIPSLGKLCYVDFLSEKPVISEFDKSAGKWTVACPKGRMSRYLHSNTFFNSADSSLVQLFGYGYHKYYNELNILNLSSGVVTQSVTDLSPRYLSASGIYNGMLYIYGGKGNSDGSQELGVRLYNDLSVMDLEDYSTRTLWSLPEDCCVAASDLVFSEEGKNFYALTFNPNIFPSELWLKEFSVESGTSISLADSIRYDFIDTDSDAGLIASRTKDAFFAYVLTKTESGKYIVNVYRVNNPVATSDIVPRIGTAKGSVWWWLVAAMMFIVVAALVYSLIKRQGKKEEETSSSGTDGDEVRNDSERCLDNVDDRPLPAGVYLLGGFKVINREHEDISGKFTPLMKQLLSLMVLYTERNGGISNVELKELLWDDKSNESFSNNRGVNFKKIRTCLSEVGEVDMVSRNGKWCITDEDGMCDWLVEKKLIDSLGESEEMGAGVEEILRLAKKGPLLPEMRSEWLDPFKAKYTESMLDLLSRFRDAEDVSPEMQVRISDLILEFDSLDEDSVRVKCNAYIKMKRLGSAQKVYKNFVEEYSAVMGEDFTESFKEFVKKAR